MTGVKVSEPRAPGTRLWPAQARAPLTRTRPWRAGVWRPHRLIIIGAGLSLVPRGLASLALRPAVFTPDSFGYLPDGGLPLP